MIGGAAYWARTRGKKTVLPGLWPADLDWLGLMQARGVLQYIDAVGIHGYPGARNSNGAAGSVKRRRCANGWGSSGVTRATVDHAGRLLHLARRRARAGERLRGCAGRAGGAHLLARRAGPPSRSRRPMDTFHSDEREYHYGLKARRRQPQTAVSSMVRRRPRSGPRSGPDGRAPAPRRPPAKACADHRRRGFHRHQPGGPAAGGRPADAHLRRSLAARRGRRTSSWLRGAHGDRVQVEIADVRNPRRAAHGGPRGRAGVSLRRAGGGDYQPGGPAPRFRSERGRNAEPAGGDPRARKPAAAAVHLH